MNPNAHARAAAAILALVLPLFTACRPLAHETPATPTESPAASDPPRPAATPAPSVPGPSAAGRPADARAAPAARLAEIFPHVRLDRVARVVEFDATVPVDCHDPQTPIVYLELVCCSPDTREHESLLVTRARPSHIHAAMLAAGFQNGRPGLVDFRGQRVEGRPPEGDTLSIRLRRTGPDGTTIDEAPEDWIENIRDGAMLGPLPEGPGVWGRDGGWVFAGSRFVNRRNPETGAVGEVYDADGAGQVIGLTTFGSETIAWRQILSPESAITAPVWIARRSRVPTVGTPIVVRLSPAP